MVDDYSGYEFCVQIWPEDGVWNYSVIQEFLSRVSEDVQVLAYGEAATAEEAAALASIELKNVRLT